MSIHFGNQNNASWLTLDGVKLHSSLICGPAHDIKFQNLEMAGQLLIFPGANNNACSDAPAMNNNNIVFDNVNFSLSDDPDGHSIIEHSYEGRVQFLDQSSDTTPAGLTIKNSMFNEGPGNGRCGDLMQFAGGGNGIIIGPGNTFENNNQDACDAFWPASYCQSIGQPTPCAPHSDSIQGSSLNRAVITGNYFHDVSTGIVNYDGGATNVTVTNNVFQNIEGDNVCVGGSTGLVVEHNTDITGSFTNCTAHDVPGSTGSIFRNNIVHDDINNAGTGTFAIKDYNFCITGTCAGAHSISNQAPTFIGGASPTTFAGFALNTGSAGKNAASDGTDIGINATSINCTTTLNSGASVSNAVSSAAAGSTICLNAGTYSFNASINKSAMTTVIAAPGVSKSQVTFTTLNVQNSNNLTFQTFSGGFVVGLPSLGGAAHNITIKDFIATSDSCIYAGNNGPLNITIDGGYFGNLGQSCTEGRLGIHGLCPATDYTVDQNIVIKNSEFSSAAGGASDGIQTTCSPRGVIIGPGNYFHDILEGNCGTVHCDAVQPYAASRTKIIGNFFYNNSDSIMDGDCNDVSEVSDNVMYQEPSSATYNVLLSGLSSGALIYHNTLGPNSNIAVGGGNQGCTSTGVTLRDNAGGEGVQTTNCTSCTVTNNPTAVTFVGGTTPTAWSGFQLSSPLNTATDGGNVGSRIFGQSGSTNPPPSDPTPPTVSLTAPSAGATVSGSSVTLSANASDNVAVSSVQFKVDGTSVTTDTGSPYTYAWDSTTVANGTHTITAVATDSSGNTTTSSSVSVTVNNTGNINIGETTITPSADNGNANLVLAQQATLFQSASIQSLSFYVTMAAGKLRLGVYDATGPSGGPGTKLAETAEITPTTGWNTAATTAHPTLTAGTYWLAYFPSDNNLAFRKSDTSSVSSRVYNVTYGLLPNTLTTPTSTTPSHWSLYATLTIASSGPKTGDINNDNNVNITDLSLLLSSYNQNVTKCTTNNTYTCDLSSPGDGVVNIFDLSILLSHYGA